MKPEHTFIITPSEVLKIELALLEAVPGGERRAALRVLRNLKPAVVDAERN